MLFSQLDQINENGAEMIKALLLSKTIIFSVTLCGLLLASSATRSQMTKCDRQALGAIAPSWSTDGAKLVYSSNRDGNWEIYAKNTDGSNPRRLTHLEAADDYFPYFSPDNRKIVFMSIDTSGKSASVCVIDADGNNLVRLSEKGGYDGDPHWSPDGIKIAFHSRRDGNENIYVMSADGGNAKQLTHHEASDTNPIWSPDGSRILFVSNRDGNAEIYVMNADGSDMRNLTNDPLFNYFPFWSPDGSKILFSARKEFRVSAGMEIYVMDADGRNRRRLTQNDVYDSAPHWSPDGTKIAFASCRTGNYEIHVMDADGSNVKRLTFTNENRHE